MTVGESPESRQKSWQRRNRTLHRFDNDRRDQTSAGLKRLLDRREVVEPRDEYLIT